MDDAVTNVRFIFQDRMSIMDNKYKRSTQVKSLTQRMQELFQNSNLTDVCFHVGESRIEFSAHRIVLATISPVFRSMLFGELYNSRKEIVITDLSPVGFRNVLRYTYDENLHFDSVNECMETLMAANKYLIESLTDVCVTFLRQRINEDNVLSILDCATFLNLPSLIQAANAVLDLHIDQLIASRALRYITHRLWGAILSREKLPCREIDLFRELHQWAICSCAADVGFDAAVADVASQRAVIGDLIHEVRFANMSVQQLVEEVRPSGLLPVDDVLSAVLESSRCEQPLRRRGLDHIPGHLQQEQQTDLVLFYHTSHVSRQCPADIPLFGCLDFRVNAKLLLRGFQLFGPKKIIPLNTKGDLNAKLACTIYCMSADEWAMRAVDDEAVLKPCSPLMNTYNYLFPSHDAALIYPNEWYRVTISLESPAHCTPISMCSMPVTRCTDLNVTFIFRKPGTWKKAGAGDKLPYCKFLAGLHYQIISQG